MNWITCVLIACLLAPISDLRVTYLSQDENKITKMYDALKSNKLRSADEECYFAVFECLQAKYSYNPYTKFTYFNNGYTRLNTLITKHKINAEYRYHRIMIEKNAPSFLIEKNHFKEDKEVIKRYAIKGHPLYVEMVKTIE